MNSPKYAERFFCEQFQALKDALKHMWLKRNRGWHHRPISGCVGVIHLPPSLFQPHTPETVFPLHAFLTEENFDVLVGRENVCCFLQSTTDSATQAMGMVFLRLQQSKKQLKENHIQASVCGKLLKKMYKFIPPRVESLLKGEEPRLGWVEISWKESTVYYPVVSSSSSCHVP